jgi:ribosomal-protein-alanine N-acetyltransferase
MAFLAGLVESAAVPVLHGSRVFLRAPQMADQASWSTLRGKSRQFLEPWEPLWAHDELTRSAFRHRVKRAWRDIEEDAAYPFFVFTKKGSLLCGGLTLSNVRRGVAQTATLGYWVGAPFARKGYMRDAVNTVLPFVFGQLGLHRLEAACLPHNEASVRLLKSNGFIQEGHARRYLKISGEWHDHLLFAMLAEDRYGSDTR